MDSYEILNRFFPTFQIAVGTAKYQFSPYWRQFFFCQPCQFFLFSPTLKNKFQFWDPLDQSPILHFQLFFLMEKQFEFRVADGMVLGGRRGRHGGGRGRRRGSRGQGRGQEICAVGKSKMKFSFLISSELFK